MLGGAFTNGELHILAARPGVGKTTLATFIADKMSSKGLVGLFVSIEMSQNQLTAKRISQQTGINFGRLINGKMDGTVWQLVGAGSGELSKSKLYTMAEPKVTVSDIAMAARRIKGIQ